MMVDDPQSSEPLPPSKKKRKKKATALTFSCFIKDDETAFQVTVPPDTKGYRLKEAIWQKRSRKLQHVDAAGLEVFKVNEKMLVDPEEELAQRASLQLRDPGSTTKLTFGTKLSDVFTEQLDEEYIHIFVIPPSVDEPAFKRARLDSSQPPRTPPSNKTHVEAKESPPRLSKRDMETNMAFALKPFKGYIEDLAMGKLDGYLDSVRREDHPPATGVTLSTEPQLLLHELGKSSDLERIKQVFLPGTTQVFETSGAGKTRLLLEGLCHHWGFYFACTTKDKGPVSGSQDFEEEVYGILQDMSTWGQGQSEENIQKNRVASRRVLAMLLCSRVFILDQFVRILPAQTDATVARRRWVLLQAMPGQRLGGDIFVQLVRELRAGDTLIMLAFIHATLDRLHSRRPDLFASPVGSAYPPYFAIVDEAQEAADNLTGYFRSSIGTDLCPILREFYDFLCSFPWIEGIILSGTGLSTKIVERSVRSVSAGYSERPMGIRIFTDMGHFLPHEPFQRNYVLRYLSLSDDNNSDMRLLERILYWFSGRHRLTASLIELLLHSENVPHHKVLSAFVKKLTGFELTDATDLEQKEGPVPSDVEERIKYLHPLSSIKHIFDDLPSPYRVSLTGRFPDYELIQCLVNIVMRWTIGSQATSVRVENQMHHIIGCGIGHLAKNTSDEMFTPDTNYPVYIDEPLAILYLRSLFEKREWTSMKSWLPSLLSAARNRTSLSFMMEEVVLMILLDKFGDKFATLDDVFAFPWASTLGSRRVRLVSLQRDADGMMRCNTVSWKSGSSDRIGFKAETPADVLKFLADPRGKIALFPDNHCGPDLMCFFKDEKTGELFRAAFQMKTTHPLNSEMWLKALESVTPHHFYTVMKDGERCRYAPVSYPDISEKVEMSFKQILGSTEYKQVVDGYRKKLRCSTAAQQEPPLTKRETPPFLRVIVAPGGAQANCLEAELMPTATLEWNAVMDYLGSMANRITTNPAPIS